MRTILNMSSRRSQVGVGAALVAAVAFGVLLGSSFAPTSEAAAQPTLGFTGGTGIVLNVVNPEKTADFERVMRAFGESLVGSSDAQRQQMGEGLKLYRAAEVGANNYALYYLFADPVVSGANYAVAQVLADEYMGGPPENGDEVREIYEAYSGALKGGGQQAINLDLVMEF
jgi:hypothetical protein